MYAQWRVCLWVFGDGVPQCRIRASNTGSTCYLLEPFNHLGMCVCALCRTQGHFDFFQQNKTAEMTADNWKILLEKPKITINWAHGNPCSITNKSCSAILFTNKLFCFAVTVDIVFHMPAAEKYHSKNFHFFFRVVFEYGKKNSGKSAATSSKSSTLDYMEARTEFFFSWTNSVWCVHFMCIVPPAQGNAIFILVRPFGWCIRAHVKTSMRQVCWQLHLVKIFCLRFFFARPCCWSYLILHMNI